MEEDKPRDLTGKINNNQRAKNQQRKLKLMKVSQKIINLKVHSNNLSL
jgi:hypothetical protein